MCSREIDDYNAWFYLYTIGKSPETVSRVVATKPEGRKLKVTAIRCISLRGNEMFSS